MAEVEPMKMDYVNESKPKIDGSDQKKKPLKRNRAELCSYASSPEERQAKINKFRNEIDGLVKFYKDLAIEIRKALGDNVGNVGTSSASLNGLIACLLEGSDLPLLKLVDGIFEKVKGLSENGDSVSKTSVKSTVLMIGQRLCYGVVSADADVLEDEADSALWCWETRELKLIPNSARVAVKVHRTCRKKLHERITAVSAMITALEKMLEQQNSQQELIKASEKLGKVLNEADIRLLMESMPQKNGSDIAEKEAKKEEKLLLKQMEKKKRELEKERKKIDRELQREKLQSEKKLKRLHDEAEKEERRREKEEHETQKQLKRLQEEAEKEQRRKEKEEAESKKRLALQKQASLMERFFKRQKTATTSEPESSPDKPKISEPALNMTGITSEPVTLVMDSLLAKDRGIEAEAIWKSHLNSWRCIGHSIRSNAKAYWGIRRKPKTELVKELKLTTNKEFVSEEDMSIDKLVDGWVDSSVDGGLSQMNSDRPLSGGQKQIQRKQLLQFAKSYRPAFYGVWAKRSQVVGGRHPFVKDPDIDYEIDSDEEWEEDEPGESLSDCDKDEEDENIEGHLKADDEDESEDGFFVPDGYLSENEGVRVGEVESDEFTEEVRNFPDSEKEVESEEFRTLLRQHKCLNNMTEHALKKNQPLVILNLMHEKTSTESAEELSGTEKLEQMCLQALSIRALPGFPNMEILVPDYRTDEDLEVSSKKSSTAIPAVTVAIPDSDLPQIVSIIKSCPHSIGKVVESLHNKFPSVPKSQLRNKVREISEFSDNRWQVKKEILSKLGLSISPESNNGKTKSIAKFFSKRCLPPSGKTIDLSEISPKSLSVKTAAIFRPQKDSSCEEQ